MLVTGKDADGIERTINVPSKVVTAVGISVNTHHGPEVNTYLEGVMAAEVLRCNAEGISTEDKHSKVIKARMLAAKQRAMITLGLEEKTR
jgi:hypothetical protein